VCALSTLNATLAAAVPLPDALSTPQCHADRCALSVCAIQVPPEGSAAGVTTIADARCTAPQSILTYLHRNASAHATLCQAGFCMTPIAQQGICGVAVEWGDLPCFSTAFDWRDGVLAPQTEWRSILNNVQTAMSGIPHLPVQSTLRTPL